ncbi:putative membrane protein [Burkholderia phage Mana]|uniref:Putative membrane protein n=1 Tax=Burkholderia phage Mana TaxID=2767578 RepID=A0A873WVC6_9CAUD|nr:hypothetical protein KNV21_gp59 [Burkholderia phage Mana]QPB09454.1 putative membrane protein [Burkholderia phage Mana]
MVTRNGRPFEEHYECPTGGASLSRAVAAVPAACLWFLVGAIRH